MPDTAHPNMSLMMRLDIKNLESSENLFADNFIWHYFNPRLPDLHGDHHGIDGLKNFFAKLGEKSHGSFQVNVIDARPAGDELVVTHVRDSMALDGKKIEFDAVVVWRIVNEKIAEAWDIPAINTTQDL